MEFTGERYTPETGGGVRYEHLHRYAIALQYVQGKQVLDLASGEGYGSYHLSKVAASVVGVDIDEAAVSHAQQRYDQQPNLRYRVGNCTQIPLDDRSVDVVVSFETIEHHDQHEQMMCEIKRVLKPDGLLIISSPNKKTYSEDLGNHNHFHIKELYLEEFNDLLLASFSQVKLYGQKLLTGSVIMPLDQPRLSRLDLCVGVSSDDKINDGIDFQASCEGLGDAIYFIALCSDFPLPSLQLTQADSGSYYLEPHNDIWNDMGKSLNQTYNDLHQKNLNLHQSNFESHELRVQLHEANRQIHQSQQNLRQSHLDLYYSQQQLDELNASKFMKIRSYWQKLKGRA